MTCCDTNLARLWYPARSVLITILKRECAALFRLLSQAFRTTLSIQDTRKKPLWISALGYPATAWHTICDITFKSISVQ